MLLSYNISRKVSWCHFILHFYCYFPWSFIYSPLVVVMEGGYKILTNYFIWWRLSTNHTYLAVSTPFLIMRVFSQAQDWFVILSISISDFDYPTRFEKSILQVVYLQSWKLKYTSVSSGLSNESFFSSYLIHSLSSTR